MAYHVLTHRQLELFYVVRILALSLSHNTIVSYRASMAVREVVFVMFVSGAVRRPQK